MHTMSRIISLDTQAQHAQNRSDTKYWDADTWLTDDDCTVMDADTGELDEAATRNQSLSIASNLFSPSLHSINPPRISSLRSPCSFNSNLMIKTSIPNSSIFIKRHSND